METLRYHGSSFGPEMETTLAIGTRMVGWLTEKRQRINYCRREKASLADSVSFDARCHELYEPSSEDSIMISSSTTMSAPRIAFGSKVTKRCTIYTEDRVIELK